MSLSGIGGVRSIMKPRESLVRNKEFEVRELQRQLAQSDMMIADFRRIADDLDRQIEAEERRTGVDDPAHFAYSTAARAARQRRDKLESSIADLEERRAAHGCGARGCQRRLPVHGDSHRRGLTAGTPFQRDENRGSGVRAGAFFMRRFHRPQADCHHRAG